MGQLNNTTASREARPETTYRATMLQGHIDVRAASVYDAAKEVCSELLSQYLVGAYPGQVPQTFDAVPLFATPNFAIVGGKFPPSHLLIAIVRRLP